MPKRSITTAQDTVFPIRLILTIALALTLLRLFVFDVRRVEGHSMEPTLRPGRIVVINRMAYGLILPFSGRYVLIWAKPAPGEIVVLREPAGRRILIKRCVGTEGDRLGYSGGRLTVGTLDETYDIPGLYSLAGAGSVPAGHILVLGDNVRDSIDSRMFGFVRETSVYGRVFL